MIRKKKTSLVHVKVNAKVDIRHLRNVVDLLQPLSSDNGYSCPILEQLSKTLKDVENQDENTIIANKLKAESLLQDGDEYVSPKYCFFAIRPVEGDLFDDKGDNNEFELHVCFKWDWYLNSQVYPFTEDKGYLHFLEDEIGECEDTDGTVSWWEGDIEYARKTLIKMGMEEKPSLLIDYANRKI